MGAREILLGTHVEVVVLHGVEHSVDALHAGNLDGAWGQAGVAVGVVGAVEGQHVVVDAACAEILHGKLHGGVGLQGHVGLQTVQVHAGNHGLLAHVGRLLVDDAGQRTHLVGGQSQGRSLRDTLTVPESVVLLDHALNQLRRRYVPVHLVGVGHEERRQRARVVVGNAPIDIAQRIGQCLGNGSRVDHQLARQRGSQTVHCATFGDGEHDGRLLAVLQLAERGQCALARCDGIAARVQMAVVVLVAGYGAQARHAVGGGHRGQLGEDGVYGVVVVDIQVLHLL